MNTKLLVIIALVYSIAHGAWADTTITTEAELHTAVQTSQTVTLGTDITLNSRIDIGGTTVTLDLNGKTLKRAMTAATDGGQVIYIANGGELTIKDCGTGGKITGGWAYQGGGIYVEAGGTLTISGGTITGNRADRKEGSSHGYGGGVENHGTLTISGGTITGNTAGQFGGGIHNEGTLSMTGGSIADNTSGQYGGGIYSNSTVTINGATIIGNSAQTGGGAICSEGVLNLHHVTITGNSTNNNGGGIYMFGTGTVQTSSDVTITGNTAQQGGGIFQATNGAGVPGPTLKMQNKPVVDNNTPNDVYLQSYQLITITGSLDAGASIGVETEVEQENFTSGYYAQFNSADPSTYFHVGSSHFSGTVGWDSSNREAKLTRTGYKYIDHTWTQATQTLTAEEKTKASGEYTPLESSGGWTELTDGGWFVVDGNISIAALKVTGTSNLILCDGAKLTLTEGVKVELKSNAVLNIYGQALNTGQLIATNSHDGAAGIGSGGSSDDGNSGMINIHGGIINATGNAKGAGIGGGDGHGFGPQANNSGLNVYGGSVTAQGGEYAAGIGSGNVPGSGTGGYVTVYGGTVTTTGGKEGAGIGGGDEGNGAMFSIYGGKVTAQGGRLAAGIGGGDAGTGGQPSFYGGTVSATGGYYGAGIGGGEGGHGGYINIYSGNITAKGGEHSAGIGGGDDGGGGMIHVYDGNSVVNATGGEGGAGIGGGYNSGYSGGYVANEDGNSGTITIEGGNVTATSISSAAGIGGGTDSHYCKVDISGGTVTAISDHDGAGIGGGVWVSGSSQKVDLAITISGGTVTTYSKGHGPGIGVGYGSHFAYRDGDIKVGEIKITGGTVIAGNTSDNCIGSGAGIGTAGFDLNNKNASDMRGSIIISGGNVTASSKTGAGIGPGKGGRLDETGLISISGGTVTATSTTCSAVGRGQEVEYVSGGGTESSNVTTNTNNLGTVMIQGGVLELSSGANFPAVHVLHAERFHLADELMVTNAGAKVGRDERANTLAGNNPTVKVEPCNHSAVGEGNSCLYCLKGTINAISLADDADNSEMLTGYNGKTVSVTISGRTLWKDGKWNTLCLPFDLTISGSVLDGDGVKAMTLNTAKSNMTAGTLTLNFDEVATGTPIPAGTPFIIKWNEDEQDVKNPVFTDVTVSTATNNTTIEDVLTFHGTFSPYTIESAEGDNGMLYLGADDKLYYPSTAMTIGAFRAFFQLSEGITAGSTGAPARIVLNFGSETSGISSVAAGKDANTPHGAWYTLDGRRLSGNPKQKGIYVSNGRKVVLQ
jgi:predicted outer membrane repeat protein